MKTIFNLLLIPFYVFFAVMLGIVILIGSFIGSFEKYE
jgi:hypothetical protein